MAAPGPSRCDLAADECYPTRTDPPHVYTDAFGFAYRLCERHYRSLVETLLRFERTRLARRLLGLYAPAPAAPPRRLRPRQPRGQARVVATAQEQALARRLSGLSQRELADLTGCSRSQLQASETGRRPLDADVAAWVRKVLDEAGTVETETRGCPG